MNKKNIFVICFSLIISFDTYAKCVPYSLREIVNEAPNIIWAEVISSNFAPKIYEGIITPKKLGHKNHEFRVRVLDVLKGSVTSQELSFKYPFAENVKEPQVLFKQNDKVVLMISSLKGDYAFLLGEFCDSWGFKAKDFKRGNKLREEIEEIVNNK